MIEPITLETARLILRPWREEDRAPFAALNADPQVTRHFGKSYTRAESDAVMDRVLTGFARHGHGPWALEVKGGAPFIGFTGIWSPSFAAHFTPCTEIGWRLAHEAWGQGYATEAALAGLRFAFGALALDEVVAYAVADNHRSLRVMERLGMRRDPADDFDHPLLDEGDPRRRHLLYRLSREAWQARQENS